jgi:hypothetical protein
MSERAESLARRFERAHQEFLSVVEPLTPEQWHTFCSDDQCTIAALTSHVAIALPFQVVRFTAIAAGQPTEPLTWAWLAQTNAEDANTYAACDHTESIKQLNQNATTTASFIRSLNADHLAHSGTYIEGVPALTLDQWIRHVLIGHITTHLTSIRGTLESRT